MTSVRLWRDCGEYTQECRVISRAEHPAVVAVDFAGVLSGSPEQRRHWAGCTSERHICAGCSVILDERRPRSHDSSRSFAVSRHLATVSRLMIVWNALYAEKPVHPQTGARDGKEITCMCACTFHTCLTQPMIGNVKFVEREACENSCGRSHAR